MALTAWLAGRSNRLVRWWLVVVAGGLVLISLAVSIVLTPLSGTIAYLVAPTRVWQLAAEALLALAGSVLARASRRTWWPRIALGLSVAGLLLILISAHWPGAVDCPGSAAIVPTAGTVALIAGGAGAPVMVQRLLA